MRKHRYNLSILIILIILVVTNPGISRFKEFVGHSNHETEGLKRQYNFLFFSIYENANVNKTYIGALLNFLDVTKDEKIESTNNLKTAQTSTIINRAPQDSNIVGPIYKTHKGTYTKAYLLSQGYSEEVIRKQVYDGKFIPITQTDQKMKLWGVLQNEGIFDKTYESFLIKYSNIDSVNYLFNGVSDEQLFTKSKIEFFKKYFPELSDQNNANTFQDKK